MALNPNLTWLQFTDDVLGLCRLRKIRTSQLFDSNPSSLSSFQASAKNLAKFVHDFMGIRATEWFAQAAIQLPIDSVTANATFNLDTGINPDFLIPNSFFNTTSNSSDARPLPLWSDVYFNTRFPDPTVITSGPPEAVVLQPANRSNSTNPSWQVRIYPNPDQAYQLIYKAKLNVPMLKLSTDQVLWPYEYQTQLTAYTWMLQEMALGEGKDMQLREVAQKIVNDVKLVGTIAPEARKSVKLFKGFSRMSTSRLRYLFEQRPDGILTFDDYFINSPLDPLPQEISKLPSNGGPYNYGPNYWGL